MNELINQTNRNADLTPIEIELGIDQEGRTTAKRLYKYLELHPAHYSRWFKSNVEENDFADEGVEYFHIHHKW